MKRFLYIGTLSLVLLSGAPHAFALVAGDDCDASTSITPPLTCFMGKVQDPALGAPSANPAQPASKQDSIPPAPDLSDAFGSLMAYVMSWFAWLTGIAGVLLNNVVYYTILQMGHYMNTLTGIRALWTICRDIGNIVLIFGFIFLGITLILNVDWYGSAKKMLPILLLAAVFLNFSLFISEAIVDAGNIFASEFYTQINGGTAPQPLGLFSKNNGVSDKIMDTIGLSTLYNIRNQPNLNGFKITIVGILACLLFLVAAFVMFSLAFVLIFRFIALVFLIIIAPIGFAGLAVPRLEGTARQWWTTLFQQTVTAPALLLMLYIALKIITDVNFFVAFGLGQSGQPANKTALFTDFIKQPSSDPNAILGFASILLSYLIAMGLLFACTILAKRMSAFGASWATKWAGALSFGLTAYGTSFGLGGSAFLARKALQRYRPDAPSTRFASNWILRPLERARPDIRRIPGVAEGLRRGGAEEAAHPISRSAPGQIRRGIEAVQHINTDSDRDYDRETRVPRLRQAIERGDAAAITRMYGTMSNKELEAHAVAHMISSSPYAAALLSQPKFDALQSSDALTTEEKNHLRQAREAGVAARFTNDPYPPGHPYNALPGGPYTIARVTIRGAPAVPAAGGAPAINAVQGMSDNQVAELGNNILRENHVIALLTPSHFSAIERRRSLEPAVQTQMGTYLANVLNGATPPPPDQPNFVNRIQALRRRNEEFRNYYNL